MFNSLPAKPNLTQLKLQARELRQAFNRGEHHALARLKPHQAKAKNSKGQAACSLQDAQLVVAREYGFLSWPAMTHHIAALSQRAARIPGQPHDMDTLRRHLREKYAPSREALYAILEKYQLGHLKSFRSFPGCNVMNSVYELEREQGDALILKIQHHPMLSWSLQQGHYVIQLLNTSSSLPVSSLCILDTEQDIVPHSYLLCNKLSGQDGSTFFLEGTPTDRCQLSAELGRVNAVLHSVVVADPTCLFNSGLNQWRTVIESALVDDGAFRQELATQAPEFFPQLTSLMAALDLPDIIETPVLVWPEGDFHNLLVKKRGSTVRITGMFDFQSAMHGSRLFSFVHAEGNFLRKPEEVYADPAYLDAFYRGYEEAGGQAVVYEDWQRTLVDIMRHARQVRYWWDCMEFLHPKNPQWLQRVLEGLEKLDQRS